MQKRSLTLLAGIALVAVVAAFWVTGERQAMTETDDAGPLVPGLSEQLNAVTELRIRDAENSVTLERGESDWRVTERGGYPADLKSLRRKLMALAESERLERKTANPDNYPMLGVEDVDSEGASSSELTLEGLEQPVSLILGKENYQGGQSTYVRVGDAPESWLASGSLGFDGDPASWLRKDVINVSSARVREVVLTHPDGETVQLLKPEREAPNFLLLNLPEGRELQSPSAGNSIAGALGSLRLDDVRPVDPMSGEPDGVIEGVYRTFDGLEVTTRAWQEGDDHFVQLAVRFDPALVVAEPESQPASEPAADEPAADADDAAIDDDDGAPGSDPSADQAVDSAEDDGAGDVEATDVATEDLASVDSGSDGDVSDEPSDEPDVSEEVAAMAGVVDGWVFQIPSYKYANLSKRLEDLLKPLPESEDDAE